MRETYHWFFFTISILFQLIGHKKPSVPIYASNLTLLEPTKGPTKPADPEPTLVDTNKEEPQKQVHQMGHSGKICIVM